MTGRLTLDMAVAASPNQMSSEVGDEAVILGLPQGRYYGLNPVGLFVWRLLGEPRRVSQICDAVVAAYRVDRDRVEADVLDLLGKLLAEGLVRV